MQDRRRTRFFQILAAAFFCLGLSLPLQSDAFSVRAPSSSSYDDDEYGPASYSSLPGARRGTSFRGSAGRGGGRTGVAQSCAGTPRQAPSRFELPVCGCHGGGCRMKSGFGWRRHPVRGGRSFHHGVDIAPPVSGQTIPIVAAANGCITRISHGAGGYGRRIELAHGSGMTTAYSHLAEFAPGFGPCSCVRKGQIIGYMGNTGTSTGVHLDFEVRQNGRSMDPARVTTGISRGPRISGGAGCSTMNSQAAIRYRTTQYGRSGGVAPTGRGAGGLR